MGEKNTNNSLVRRVNKLLESRVENDKVFILYYIVIIYAFNKKINILFQDTLEALKELSTFFTENTLNSRRNLRSKIERRSLAINEEFLSAFREVKSSLDGIHQDVLAMNNAVQCMTNRLQTTKTQTSQLIDQTAKLQNKRYIYQLSKFLFIKKENI